MKKIFLSSLFFLCVLSQFGQTITLTFLGKDAPTQINIPLESVYIQNTTLGCDTIIYGANPSIVLTSSLGIDDPKFFSSEPFKIMSPSPNPFNSSTIVQVEMNQGGKLQLSMADSRGFIVSEYENDFSLGLHRFEIKSSMNNLFLLTVSNGSCVKSVKLICNGFGNGENKIIYLGISDKTLKTAQASSGFSFQFGNQLLYKSIKAGYYDAIITDSPTQNSTYTFQLTQSSELPTVISANITYITQTTASSGGNVTFDGGSTVNARGVCWSTSSNPTIADNHTIDGSGTGTFTSNLTGLTPNTPYFVRAYATNSVGTAYGNEISFLSIDPNELLTMLTDTVSKTWKLLRDVSTGDYPLEVGPFDRSTIWWAVGLNNDELALRSCMLNDEWTFGRDGSLVFDAKGDYWAEYNIFPDPGNFCASTDVMIGKNGEDLSAWGGGTFAFELVPGADPKLKAIGTGAYVGFFKSATDYEVTKLTPMVQDEITYNLVKLTDAAAGTDTLIIETNYYFEVGDPAYGGYWRYVLVHYDDPNDEPPIPDPKPVPGFTFVLDGYTATFTNTSTLSDNYLWDFGDGATSTEVSPVHVYAGDGIYTVTLTAYNANGEKSTSQTITVTTAVLTEAVLTAGPWKLQVSGHSIYVGPGMGSDAWWICPLGNLDGTFIGTVDDWSCMTDDEFIFSTGGGFEYKTNGSSRNDGYMGTPNGCWSDADIAASPGAAFGSCATHTFAFTPATETTRAIVVLTNGPGFAAFLGFYKGYYGGENTNNANPPNGGLATNQYEVMGYAHSGGKEVLVVTVDLSADHSGTSAWTMVLER